MFYKLSFKLGTVMLISLFVSACATTDYANKANISIERVDSSTVNISRAYITKIKDGLLLRGEVKRKLHSHGTVPGHIHIELVNPEGNVIKTAEVEHSRKANSDHIADFQVLLPQELGAGSVVRIVHHDASSHKEDEGVDWLDVDN